jgi:hypothetical protein
VLLDYSSWGQGPIQEKGDEKHGILQCLLPSVGQF